MPVARDRQVDQVQLVQQVRRDLLSVGPQGPQGCRDLMCTGMQVHRSAGSAGATAIRARGPRVRPEMTVQQVQLVRLVQQGGPAVPMCSGRKGLTLVCRAQQCTRCAGSSLVPCPIGPTVHKVIWTDWSDRHRC